MDNLFEQAIDAEKKSYVTQESAETLKVESTIRCSSPNYFEGKNYKNSLSPLITKLSACDSSNMNFKLLPPIEYNIRGGRFLTLVLNLDDFLICT